MVPVAGKWLLVGRCVPEEFPLWGLRYLRFWFVRSLIRTSPLVLFAGSPLYVLYLRALGAKSDAGRPCSRPRCPPAPDLLTIGAGTVIRSEVAFSGYRAIAGRIQTGRVRLGRDVVVGEASVLDIDVAMGTEPSSATHRACTPARSCRPGSAGTGPRPEPTTPTTDWSNRVDAARCGKIVYSVVQLAILVGLLGPIGLGLVVVLLTRVPYLAALLGPGNDGLLRPGLYRDAVVIATVLLFGGLLVGLVVVLTVPRLLNLLVRPDVTYPLYGVRYFVQQLDHAADQHGFTRLLGDSVVRHRLPDRPRVQLASGGADGVELRPDHEARDAVPDLGRDRHHDLGRPRPSPTSTTPAPRSAWRRWRSGAATSSATTSRCPARAGSATTA